MVDVYEIVTENKSEDIKYKFYVRDRLYLLRYFMINMYIAVERFIILGRPL